MADSPEKPKMFTLSRLIIGFLTASIGVVVLLFIVRTTYTYFVGTKVLGANISIATEDTQTKFIGAPLATIHSQTASNPSVLPHTTSKTKVLGTPFPTPVQITCTGPDGKQFQTTQTACDALNKAWGK